MKVLKGAEAMPSNLLINPLQGIPLCLSTVQMSNLDHAN